MVNLKRSSVAIITSVVSVVMSVAAIGISLLKPNSTNPKVPPVNSMAPEVLDNSTVPAAPPPPAALLNINNNNSKTSFKSNGRPESASGNKTANEKNNNLVDELREKIKDWNQKKQGNAKNSTNDAQNKTNK